MPDVCFIVSVDTTLKNPIHSKLAGYATNVDISSMILQRKSKVFK